MHEFSIIQNIVEIVLESARQHHAEQVSRVEVEVGQASGVVKEAMEFAWEAAGKGTLVEHASLVLKEIPLKARCRTCRTLYYPCELFDPCPECGSPSPEILEGRELRVVAIET